ncbi:MAG: hypothetical protein JST00_22705 [Deltaproteobacteria bacterium]|nr:hypothetical protein [Deltaproteobacteria bacterium]
MKRKTTLATILVTLVVAACLSALRQKTTFPTSYFRFDSGVGDGAFDLQLLLLFVGVALLQVVPARFARAVAIAEGVACLAVHGVAALGFLGALAAFYLALEVPLPRKIRPLVPIVLLTAFGVLGSRWVRSPAALFGTMFAVRLLVYAWDKWQRGYPPGRLGDFALYVMCAPLVVFPPYVVVAPFYDRHASSFAPRVDAARLREACAHLGVGLFAQLLRVTVPWALGSKLGWTGTILSEWVVYVLAVARIAYVTHGLLLLHGFVDRPPLKAPLLATDFVAMWNRFLIHQKDLQVAFFYAPTLIRLRRKNRYVAIVCAVAVTMFVGNLLLHFLVRYAYMLPTPPRFGALYAFYAISFVLLSATLCLEEWRRRTKRRPRGGALGAAWTVLCWSATQLVTAWLASI